MPTNRRALRRGLRRRITPEAIAAWREVRALQAAGAEKADRTCEEGAARYRRYLDAWQGLRRALGLPPWAITPDDPRLDGERPDYLAGLGAAATWDPARALRAALLEAERNRG